MSEENKPNEAEKAAEVASENNAEPKKSNLVKYIIYAVCGLVIIVGIAFGTSYFLAGGQQSAEVEQAEEVNDESAPASETHDEATINTQDEPIEKVKNQESGMDDDDGIFIAKKGNATATPKQNGEKELAEAEPTVPSIEEQAMDEYDETAIEKIMANLEFLDYQPETGELAVEETKIEAADNSKELKKLDDEKKRLAAKEKELNERERQLNKLEMEINGKINRLDQAESSRIGKLAKLYDSMDSRSVAKLMMNLDDNTVVAIIPKMKNKNAAAVLQLLPSQRAARLSKQLITVAGTN